MTRAKIYTKSGDRGQTSLVGGTRVSKADQRLEAYGTLDELNSAIGLVRARATVGVSEAAAHIDHRLRSIQHALFNIGSQLACEVPDLRASLPTLKLEDTPALETDMDRWETELPPLKEFILPGGTEAAATAHLARTICRRAERAMQRMSEAEYAVDSAHLIFVNRLSDWLFLLARRFNASAGVADVTWSK